MLVWVLDVLEILEAWEEVLLVEDVLEGLELIASVLDEVLFDASEFKEFLLSASSEEVCAFDETSATAVVEELPPLTDPPEAVSVLGLHPHVMQTINAKIETNTSFLMTVPHTIKKCAAEATH